VILPAAVSPSGSGNSGSSVLPNSSSSVQRVAISMVFSSALGTSPNNAAISSALFRYCSGL